MHLTQTRLLVRDYPASFRFWRDAVGLPVTSGTEEGTYASFDTGRHQLAIFELGLMEDAIGQQRSEGSRGPDQSMLGFQVDDVDRAAVELEGRGITFVSQPADQSLWGIRVAHFRDPEGNLVELWTSLREQGE